MNLKKLEANSMRSLLVSGLALAVVGGGLVYANRNGALFFSRNKKTNNTDTSQSITLKKQNKQYKKGSLDIEKFPENKQSQTQDTDNANSEQNNNNDSNDNTDKNSTVSSINLTASARNGGVDLKWTVDGDASGFKVVGSLNSNPTYPNDKYYFVDGDKRTFFWGVNDGKKWHFRVCSYADGKCDTYSNEVSVDTLKSSTESTDNKDGYSDSSVKSISVSLEKVSSDRVKVKWTVDGKAERGFKVIWSKNPNPEYPTRNGDYFHFVKGGDAREETIKTGSGHKYHIRVCNYLGDGKCGTYSPDVEIQM